MPSFAAPAKGNEKGCVENMVGYVRRNFMVPLPNFKSFEDFNKHLLECCNKRKSAILRGHSKTIGERMLGEEYLPMPTRPYEACIVASGRVTKEALVRFCRNDYSVPTTFGCQKVFVKGYPDKVVIILKDKIVAEHRRCYGSGEAIFNPLHYLKLLERKTRAFEQAAPMASWNLPPVFLQVHNILQNKDGKNGVRAYIRILQFLEYYTEQNLKLALEQAIALNLVNESAILHLLKRNLEQKPPKLTLIDFPNIPATFVPAPNISAYSKALLAVKTEGVAS